MSGIYRERMESVLHREWVGEKCDGCAMEYLYPESTKGRIVPRPSGWLAIPRSAETPETGLCAECAAKVFAFIEGLKP